MHRPICSIFAVLAVFTGCAAESGDEGADRDVSPFVLPGADKCDPNDPTCAPSSCDDGTQNCDPKVPPCEPGNTNCDPKVPPKDPCKAQEVKADATCNSMLGYAWDGSACYALSGCACSGPDCNSLFKTQEACEAHYQICKGGSADECKTLAKQLATLLGDARACNIASAQKSVCDGTFVPTTQGCPVPVASGTSPETKAYLELYSKYAQVCDLPVPPCPNPKGLPVGCVQGPDVDGLMGQCGLLPGDSTAETQ